MFLYGYSLTSIFFSFKGESNDGIALVKITGSNKCKSSSADVLVVMPKARSTNGMGFFQVKNTEEGICLVLYKNAVVTVTS